MGTHNADESFWSEAGTEDWAREMAGSRLIIEKFSPITDNSVVGLRAPYLRVGGNNQFTMMEEQGFLYHSSPPEPSPLALHHVLQDASQVSRQPPVVPHQVPRRLGDGHERVGQEGGSHH